MKTSFHHTCRLLIAPLLISLMITLASSFANAENSTGGTAFPQLASESSYTLYLPDGRLLFAKISSESDGQRIVREIICIDQGGNQLWTCEVPPADLISFMELVQLPDGTFAFLGRANGDPYLVTLIEPGGTILGQFSMPEKVYTPALASTGIYFSNGSDLCRMGWDKQTHTLPLLGVKSLNLNAILASGTDTCLSFFTETKVTSRSRQS